MTIQRIGTTEGMQAIPGIKVMPIISFAVEARYSRMDASHLV